MNMKMKMKMKMKMMLVLLLLSLYLINHLDASPVNRHSRSLSGIPRIVFKGFRSFVNSRRNHNQPHSFFGNTEPRRVWSPSDPSLPGNIKPPPLKEPDPKYPRLPGGKKACDEVCAHVVDSAFWFAQDTGSPDLCKKKLADAGVQASCAAACKGVRDGPLTASSAAARAASACGDAASLADPPALAPH